jgi:hypothetical protein
MLEVLLPKVLPDARRVPTARDIVLMADEASQGPLRCTITCMSKPEYQRIVESTDVRFVDTSEWESTGALENDSHVWTWTLRASKNDAHFSDKVRMVLLGPVKWAEPSPRLR